MEISFNCFVFLLPSASGPPFRLFEIHDNNITTRQCNALHLYKWVMWYILLSWWCDFSCILCIHSEAIKKKTRTLFCPRLIVLVFCAPKMNAHGIILFIERKRSQQAAKKEGLFTLDYKEITFLTASVFLSFQGVPSLILYQKQKRFEKGCSLTHVIYFSPQLRFCSRRACEIKEEIKCVLFGDFLLPRSRPIDS